ncbi:substrate-binding domain-containing protein [Robiginitalea sp. M366]|uniref:substrate-binding domain-containing protein n=1 Tax=Robiginitalea aestuariiviva TaxID=3036903 RepID=UPI00240D4524|nr:substrate-binding domain-containing protein [Robiginitalea aestuariiviva]MDG1572886.1 substrate-binding domain-containing protein [Robiginitalea aestuariiviva]
MQHVRVIGVPEHFNLPWMMALEEGAFAEQGIDLVWEDIPEGSGRMAQMLKADEADLALILTDGLLKAVADGLEARILQEYVGSPLLWGIHVAAKSPYKTSSDVSGKVAAISRPGSGSQLMAYVHAKEMGWPLEALKFEVVHTLNGAIEALTAGRADYFLWERFTTQPVVDRGVFRRIGECPTPWPCFVLAGRSEFLQAQRSLAQAICRIINTYTSEFRQIPSIDRTLSNRYGLRLEDVQTWLELTRWSQHQIDSEVLDNAITTLSKLNLLNKDISPSQILA